jgi:hypothetical protein
MTPDYLKRQRTRYRNAAKEPHGLPPTWPGIKAPADKHIPDHAFLPTDEYQPRTHEATVVTQHPPHTQAEPSTHALIAAAIQADNKRKPLKKTNNPDAKWLEKTDIFGRPQKNEPVDWTRFQLTTHDDIYMCKTCRTLLHGSYLDTNPRAQRCPRHH